MWKCFLSVVLIEMVIWLLFAVLSYYRFEFYYNRIVTPLQKVGWIVIRTIHRVDYFFKKEEPLF